MSECQGLHQVGAFRAVKALGWTVSGGWPDNDSVDSDGDPRIAPNASTGDGPALKKQRRNMRIPYYWAVPEQTFNEGWRTRQPAKKGSEEAAVDSRLVQYAISIPSQLMAEVADAALTASGVPMPEDVISQFALDQRTAV